MNYIKPPKLKKGNKVGLVSPSNPIKHRVEEYKKAKKRIENRLGIEIVPSKNAFKEFYYSAGTAEERVDDINAMFDNSEIKAILFSIGGNTAIDLVEKLNYDLIKKNPKIVCGISDATTLLNSITAKTGLITFSGMEYFTYAKEKMHYEFENMEKAWFNGEINEIKPNPKWTNFDKFQTQYNGWQTIKPGKAVGRLVGGNFSSYAQLLNTEYMTELQKNILIMETYMFSKNQIHQTLMQLRLKGIFKKISGFIVGYCTGSDNPDKQGNDRKIKDVLLETTKEYDFPIMEIGEIGHCVENIIIPIGAKATLDATNKKFIINEKTVI
ncbi:LD-carboxypeptidase [Candidatus Parcubacteria bacterium]|nr:LD-carboxypeptidase [Candidatus Parcubacteria bacterium]